MKSLQLPTILDDDDGNARVSRFDVERLACGELTGDDEARVRRALENDAALRAVYNEIVAEDAAFRITSPAPAFVARVEAARAPSLWARAIALLRLPQALAAAGAAAALVIAVSIGGGDATVVDPIDVGSARTKGAAPRVAFFVKSGATARAGVPGEALRKGDQIQLALTDADKTALVVVGIDGAGQVSVYAAMPVHTAKGASAAPRPLPQALVLDGTVGAERFFAVYGDDLAATEAKASAAAAALAKAVRAGDVDLAVTSRLPLDAAFVQASVHITKVP